MTGPDGDLRPMVEYELDQEMPSGSREEGPLTALAPTAAPFFLSAIAVRPKAARPVRTAFRGDGGFATVGGRPRGQR